jgi:hypothetical protein
MRDSISTYVCGSGAISNSAISTGETGIPSQKGEQFETSRTSSLLPCRYARTRVSRVPSLIRFGWTIFMLHHRTQEHQRLEGIEIFEWHIILLSGKVPNTS